MPQLREIPTTATFLERLAAGERTAIDQFMAVYYPAIADLSRTLLNRHLPGSGDGGLTADEIASDVYVRAQDGVAGKRYDPERSPFRKWLFGVTWNTALEHLRKWHRGPDQLSEYEQLAGEVAEEGTWDERVGASEREAMDEARAHHAAEPVKWQCFCLIHHLDPADGWPRPGRRPKVDALGLPCGRTLAYEHANEVQTLLLLRLAAKLNACD